MSAFTDYVRNVFGRKSAGSLSIVQIVADIAGASGAVTLDVDDSSPEVTIARATTGQYTITFPGCQTVAVVGAHTLLAEAVGSAIYFESLSASAGTGAFETAVNTAAATAADPADGSRLFITLLCGKN